MLGPLPTLYRVIVSACALLLFVGIGAWVGQLLPDSFVPPMGVGIGAAIGVIAAVLLLHDSDHPHRHRVHVRSRRH